MSTMSTHVFEINDGNFDREAAGSPLPLLVDFTSTMCPPCRAIAPHVDAVAGAYAGRVRVGKCDVDDSRELAARFDVRAVPTLMLFREGRVVAQIVGAVPRAKIEALIAKAM
jgi:thioredoxin 1